MLRVSRNIMLDLESEVSCKITLPEVAAVFGNTVTIDLGRMHGVQQGDKLRYGTPRFIDQRGLPRNKVSQSDITLTVSRVYENEAELTLIGQAWREEHSNWWCLMQKIMLVSSTLNS